jgi:sodium transport system permease protein
VIAVAATVLYAMIALVFAARAFGREDVLFGAGGGDVDAGAVRARLRKWRRAPLAAVRGEAAMLVTFIGLLYFYVGRPLMMRLGENGIWASQLLLLALPALCSRWSRARTCAPRFALRAAPPRAFAAALLIILGGIPLGWLIAWLQGFVIAHPRRVPARRWSSW